MWMEFGYTLQWALIGLAVGAVSGLVLKLMRSSRDGGSFCPADKVRGSATGCTPRRLGQGSSIRSPMLGKQGLQHKLRTAKTCKLQLAYGVGKIHQAPFGCKIHEPQRTSDAKPLLFGRTCSPAVVDQ